MNDYLDHALQLLEVLSQSLEGSEEHAGRFYQVALITKEVNQALAALAALRPPGGDFRPAHTAH
jgi:hypothetical protein